MRNNELYELKGNVHEDDEDLQICFCVGFRFLDGTRHPILVDMAGQPKIARGTDADTGTAIGTNAAKIASWRFDRVERSRSE